MHYAINTLDQLAPILKGYRKSNGLTQQDMADRLAITQQAYQALESNPKNATLERIMKVLNVLGVKLYLSDSSLLSVDMPSKEDKSFKVAKSAQAKIVDYSLVAAVVGQENKSVSQPRSHTSAKGKSNKGPSRPVRIITSHNEKDKW